MGTQIGSFFKSKYTGQQIENALDTFDSMAADYDATATYAVGDVVLYNNDLYICNTAASAEAFDPTKWTQTTLADLAESIAQTEGAAAGTTAAQAVLADTVQVNAQSFNSTEKAQARSNIDAASTSEAVLVTAQTFSTSQMTQARTNINAASIDEAVLVTSQTFSTSQMAQARSNIDAAGVDEAVLVVSQTFTTSEQAQARTNINAADADDAVLVTAQSFTDAEKAQARVNILAAKLPSKTVSNDPDNSSFTVEMSDAEDAPVASTVISGKTAAVNQLVQNGNFESVANWSTGNLSYSVSGNVATLTIAEGGTPQFYQYIPTVSGHKYFIYGEINPSVALTDFYIRFGSVYGNPTVSSAPANTWTVVQGMKDAESSSTEFNFYRFGGILVANDTVKIRNANCIDLSLIFSSTELTAIGTDVSALKTYWLAKFGYPLPQYIPYNTGSIVSNNAVYQLTGRNLWDEEWEVGTFDNSTGQTSVSAARIRSKNYIRVNSDDRIYFKIASYGGNIIGVWGYDANKNYIGRVDPDSSTNILVVPEPVAFIKISPSPTYGATYHNDICINLSDADFNGTYEPYYNGGSIDCSAAPLNGFDDTVCDEKDYATGERTNKTDIYDIGSLNWTYDSSYPRFYTLDLAEVILRAPANDTIGYVICGKYTPTSLNAMLNEQDKTIALSSTGGVSIKDTAYSDAATFTTALTGTKFVIGLATPTTTTETPQPLTTQDGYNILQPVSGDVQSGAVSVTYYRNLETVLSDIESRLSALE